METLFDRRKLEIDEALLVRDESTHESSYCFVAYSEELERVLAKLYGRSGLCMKVFKKPVKDWTKKSFGWGQVQVGETARVQNLFAWHGIAPRVFDVVTLGERVAQVVEFAVSKGEPRPDRLKELVNRFGIKIRKGYWDVNPKNWVGGLFVDFSGFYFGDPEGYKEGLVRRAHTRRGEFIGAAYQEIKELGIKGWRKLAHRVEVLRLDEVDFKGKTVLDLGCNLGAFSRLAADRGASRVVGVDRIAGLAHEVSNQLGYWNVDFIQARLPGDLTKIAGRSGIERFDIVFTMAITNHMGGFADWMVELCGGVLIFEGHGGEDMEAYLVDLQRHFQEVAYLGQTTDNYERAVFRCWL